MLLSPGETRAFTFRALPAQGNAFDDFHLRQALRTPEGPCLLDVTLDFPVGTRFEPTFIPTFTVLEACPSNVTPEPLPPELLRAAFVYDAAFNDAEVPLLCLSTDRPWVRLRAGDGRPPMVAFGDARLPIAIRTYYDVWGADVSNALMVEGVLPREELDRPAKARLDLFLRDDAGKGWSLTAEHLYTPLPEALREAHWEAREGRLARENPPPATAKELPARPKTARFSPNGWLMGARALPQEWFSLACEEGKTIAFTFRNPTQAPVTFEGAIHLDIGRAWTKLRGKPIPKRTMAARQRLPLKAFTLAPGERRTLRAVMLGQQQPAAKTHLTLGTNVQLGEQEFRVTGNLTLEAATSREIVWEDRVLRLAAPAPEGEPAPPPLPQGVMTLEWHRHFNRPWQLVITKANDLSAVRIAADSLPVVAEPGKAPLAWDLPPGETCLGLWQHLPITTAEDPAKLTLRGRVILPDGRAFTLPERPRVVRPQK